ncbi:MAG: hypothetical protein IJV93_13315 [Lentisphaeria bacterium]|nr:hypothetical protein [Lentisphaeria bacterium]
MGIFDGLFTSAESEAKEKRMKQRRAVRTVERVIENLTEKSAGLEKERTKLWEKAREQMLSGQKTAAAATLKVYKSKMVMGQRVERQLLLSQHNLDTITSASDMQQISTALASLATAMNVDPDAVQLTMDELEEKNDDIRDVTRIMDRAFDRDMAKLDHDAENSQDETEDELMKALMEEVNGALAVPESAASAAEAPAAAADINAGRDALKKLMEGNR